MTRADYETLADNGDLDWSHFEALLDASDRAAELISAALSKKLLGRFVNYGEMLEAKNLLTAARQALQEQNDE